MENWWSQHELFRIIYTFLLEHLRSNGYNWIFSVTDDLNEGIRTIICNSFYQGPYNTTIPKNIDVEKLIWSNAWLSWKSCRDDHHIYTLQRISQFSWPSKSRICAWQLQWLRPVIGICNTIKIHRGPKNCIWPVTKERCLRFTSYTSNWNFLRTILVGKLSAESW